MSELTRLYELHERGELGDQDERWLRVQKLLKNIAKVVGSRTNKYGEVITTMIEGVYESLLIKFLNKKFKCKESSIEPLIYRAASNDLISEWRKFKSPCTVYFDGAEETWSDNRSQETQPSDPFFDIRTLLSDTRFPEYPHIREGILAFLLMNRRYPEQSYLHALGVKAEERETVFNAAVFDINRAIMKHCYAT